MTRAAVLALLALALLAAPAGAQGGGSVGNVAPSVASFASQSAVTGRATRLFGVVADGNGEGDMAALRLHLATSPQAWSNHTLTATDLQHASEPSSAVGGWRVWDPVAADGRLSFSYEWVPAGSGARHWDLTVLDEAANGTAGVTVSVQPARGGGGGGGGPAPSPPPDSGSVSASSSDTGTDSSQPATSTASGGTTDGTGAPSADDLAGMSRDITWSLRIGSDGKGNVLLDWNEVPGAMGYQVWRHTSPWALRAEVTSGAHYQEPAPSRSALYKVTFFTERTAAGGWVGSGSDPSSILGWNETTAAVVTHSPVQAPEAPAWAAPVLAGTALLVGLAFVPFVRRRR